jgi:hypothetical protein
MFKNSSTGKPITCKWGRRACNGFISKQNTDRSQANSKSVLDSRQYINVSVIKQAVLQNSSEAKVSFETDGVNPAFGIYAKVKINIKFQLKKLIYPGIWNPRLSVIDQGLQDYNTTILQLQYAV